MAVNNSFTWSLTTGDISGTSFTTLADWVSVNNGDTQTPNFSSGTSDYSILTGGAVSGAITGVSGVNIDSLTLDAPGATLVAGGADDTLTTGLTVNNGLLLATQNSGGILVGKAGGPAGVVTVGSAGTIDIGTFSGSGPEGNIYQLGAIGGSGLASLTGSGTVIADGWVQIGAGGNMTVAASSNLNFEIANNGGALDGSDNVSYLDFEGNVGGNSSVTFLGDSGYLVLGGGDVGNSNTLVNGGTFASTVTGLAVSASDSLINGIDIATGGYNGPSPGLSAALSGTNNDTLTLTDGDSNNYVINLAGNYTTAVAEVQTDSIVGGFDVFLMVCYAAGTSITTDRGEADVESLQPGDTVMTLVDGAQVPRTVKWVGHRGLDLTRHANPDSIVPIRIMQGALGENLPRRDLVLSPDHCLFFDGRLYPVKLLINDMTIVRDLAAKTVTYYHVELEQHAIMIAEGVAAESYLDTGNRAFFSNAGLAMVLHPELNINENLRCWDTDACAPLTVATDLVKPVWQRIADRAVALGHVAPVHATTKDAGIHLMVDGKVVRPLATKGKTVSFMVPANARSVRLRSRATRQSALTPWLDDPRTLGVAIRSVTLRDQSGEAVLGADHPALRDGWHAVEHAADGALWRWSAGDAALPVKTSGPCMVEIALSETATYLKSAQRLAA